MGIIIGPRSAIARNSLGGSTPRTGCCQRSRHSTATGCPVARSSRGWPYMTNSSPVTARCSSDRRRTVRSARSCSSGRGAPIRLPPAALAPYIAASAVASTWSASVGRDGQLQADAGADLVRAVRQPERHPAAGQHPAGDAEQGCQVVDVDADDGELVAAEPGDGVAGPDGVPQPGRGLHQQFVTGGVPGDVVDLLEAVDVEVQHPDRFTRPSRPGQGVLDPVVQQVPVGQAGQRIVQGLVQQRRLGLLGGGDVLDQADGAGLPVGRGRQVREPQKAVHGAAVGPAEPLLHGGPVKPTGAEPADHDCQRSR